MSKLAKKTVDLHGASGAGGPRVSKIRRDPPPIAKKASTTLRYRNEREARVVAIGILLFGIAISIVIVRVSDITADQGESAPAVIHLQD